MKLGKGKHMRFRDRIADILQDQKKRHKADPSQAEGLTPIQILDRLFDQGNTRNIPPVRTMGKALLKTAGVYSIGRIRTGTVTMRYQNVYTIDHDVYMQWRNTHVN
jgi:hypothetical protein